MTKPKTPHEHKPKREPAENLNEPRFVALSADGEFVDGDDDLDELCRVLAELVDANDAEDLVIWRGQTVAAVIQNSGQVTRFDAPSPPPDPKPAGRPDRLAGRTSLRQGPPDGPRRPEGPPRGPDAPGTQGRGFLTTPRKRRRRTPGGSGRQGKRPAKGASPPRPAF
jgi:hypothetical protein